MKFSKKESITSIFNDSFKEKEKSSNYVPKPKFRPSMLGSPCMRKVFYSYLNITPDYPFSIKSKKIMELGNKVHDMVTSTLREAGVLIDYMKKDGTPKLSFFTGEPDYEFPLKDSELEVSAKVDAVVVLDGELWIVEIKSIKHEEFLKLKNNPKPDHLLQGTIYYYLFNKLLKEGKFSHIERLANFTQAKGLKFVYVDKTTMDILEIDKKASDKIFMDIVSKILKIREYNNSRELPPKTPHFCANCQWRDKCLANLLE